MSNVDNVLFWGEENQKREELEEKGTGAEKKRSLLAENLAVSWGRPKKMEGGCCLAITMFCL